MNVALAEKADASALKTELETLCSACKHVSHLEEVLSHPNVTVEQKGQLLSRIMKVLNISELTEKFVLVITQNNRLSQLSQICQEFETVMLNRSGKIKAVVKTVCDLSVAQKNDLNDIFSKKLDKEIVWQYEKDHSVLGGAHIQIEDKVWDGTLRRQLEQLKFDLQKI